MNVVSVRAARMLEDVRIQPIFSVEKYTLKSSSSKIAIPKE